MKRYETPQMEMLVFEHRDILTVSGLTNGVDGDGDSTSLDDLLQNMGNGQF